MLKDVQYTLTEMILKYYLFITYTRPGNVENNFIIMHKSDKT